MPIAKASDVVRKLYSAYEENDRDLAEAVVAEDFTFSSPPDPHLDRAGYFERCWPNSEQIKSFRFQKIIEDDGEVFMVDRREGPRVEVSALRSELRQERSPGCKPIRAAARVTCQRRR